MTYIEPRSLFELAQEWAVWSKQLPPRDADGLENRVLSPNNGTRANTGVKQYCQDCAQGSYKKLNLKFKNIQEHFWGENKFVQEHFRRVIRTFYLQYYQQSHFVPLNKSLTEVGALKNVNNGYYRKNRHSVLLRGMLFNQEMNVQR